MRLLNLAPHCQIPPMTGADRRAWHLHENVVSAGVDGHFIGRQATANEGSQHNGAKIVTALSALLVGQDYWQRKMLTRAFRQSVDQVHIKDYNAVIIHFLYSVSLIGAWRGERLRLLIDTHNYDPAFFAALGNASRNPVRHLLCRRAIRTAHKALAFLPEGTTLVHVSQSDLAAYQHLRPDLNHVVVENGCQVAPRGNKQDYAVRGKKELLFVGSLSVQQNQDALFHLSKAFWPLLRETAYLHVAGSNPPRAVKSLCAAHGWQLHSNVSDAELEALYDRAHYALAPFTYGAGSKLKLLEACGRGVPLITTEAGATGLSTLPPLVHVSDHAEDWQCIIANGPPRTAAIRETLEFAKQLSWGSLGAKLARIVETAPIAKI